MTCMCWIIPTSVLKRFADDPELSAELRQRFQHAIEIDNHIRAVRQEAALVTTLMSQGQALAGLAPAVLAAAPLVTVYDCKHSTALPGAPVAKPGTSADATSTKGISASSVIGARSFGSNGIDELRCGFTVSAPAGATPWPI